MSEPRWPGLAAVGCVLLLQLLLPQPMAAHRAFGFYSVVLVVLLASAALLMPKWHVALGYATSVVSTGVLAYALIGLVEGLISDQSLQPVQLLGGALLIWSMNILVFAAWYWRIDAGGPHRRSKHTSYRNGAFLFPQLTLPEQHGEWRPRFVDYLFLSFNTSTAFSPTDAPVLSRWAKVLMMVQSTISLTTLAIVAARAVNILGSKSS
jgi:uncharacterized membrane protein